MATKNMIQHLGALEQRVKEHAMYESSAPSGRKAVVTVGATTTFRNLLEEVGSVNFLSTMKDLGYVQITVQCGEDLQWFDERVSDFRDTYVTVETTDYITNMNQAMGDCRGSYGVKPGGVVISHGGKILHVSSHLGTPYAHLRMQAQDQYWTQSVLA